MMSKYFRPKSELSGAIAKKLPHAKNQLSAPGSFFDQFVTFIYIQARFACLRCAAGGDFVSAEGSLRSPGVTLVNYKGDNISKYVCPTDLINMALKITKNTSINF